MEFANRNCLIEEYLQIFQASDGNEYGLRYAKKKDAKECVEIFKDAYGWKYLYPWVYNLNSFEKHITREDKYWVLVESINKKDICAIGLMEKKNKYAVYASKVITKSSYRGLGLLRHLSSLGVLTVLSTPCFKDTKRLENDIRANSLNSQLFAERLGCIPYGFIPNYNNYADKRDFDPLKKKPFTDGQIEPVIMYFTPLSRIIGK